MFVSILNQHMRRHAVSSHVLRSSLRSAGTRAARVVRVVQNRSESEYELESGGNSFRLTKAGRSVSLIDNMISHLLPKNFKTSVPPNYLPYCKAYAVGTIASSSAMVLSMQSLLYAIGLGAGAIPLSAAINWVLKDGLGQAGGVLFASFINNRFDADPKRWRVVAAVSMDVAMYLEALTPLAPFLFLPLATLANVGKNISWLAASATRAGIHLSFSTNGHNLADITAKAGSQTVVASTIGTGAGILLSPFVGTDPYCIVPCVVALSFIHLFAMYRSLKYVTLNTINIQRGEMFTQDYIAREQRESNNIYLMPIDVSEKEKVVGWGGAYFWGGHQTSILIGPPFDVALHSDSIEFVMDELKQNLFFIFLTRDRKIGLLFASKATNRDILQGFLAANKLAFDALNSNTPGDSKSMLRFAKQYAANHIDDYMNTLVRHGWNVDHLFLDENNTARVSVVNAL